MKLQEAVEAACNLPTLAEALTYIAVWETDRVVTQAMRNHGLYETCFRVSFIALLDRWNSLNRDE